MEIMEKPGVFVANQDEVLEMEEEISYGDSVVEDERLYSSMASYISNVYRENKDARTDSEIDEKMLQSLRAYNGHYDPEDLAQIRMSPGGSEIYMNLTPTKCRAAMSWIRDILLPAKERAWSLSPTALPSIPPEVREKIEVYLERVAQEVQEQAQAEEQAQQQQMQQEQAQMQQAQQQGGQPQQGPPPKKPTVVSATQRLQVANRIKRDVEEALLDEVYKLAEVEVKKYETIIADRFDEGNWDNALSEFIEDFCVFPVAVMKGPIITKRYRLNWVNGQPERVEEFIYLNKRVSPLDIYPSPSATSIEDGNLCEHLRLSRMELYNLIGVEGYKEENIRKVLQECSEGITAQWLDHYIEEEKVFEEYRGDSTTANKNVIHGIHFFGSLPYKILLDWGFTPMELGDDEDKEFEVEAVMAGNEVIKCVFNDDPLLRRPYYKASFQNIPGSWWGRSLPELMRDIQRMCNATARALANNMGIASGPQIEAYVDRLAADEDIEEQHPFKIWQVTSDPSGAGGRAINWYQPSSNAKELLAVYKEFELRADDATGIPRYSYGNERVGGAAQTASGLSMLLESASKGIKDAVRHIDQGLIVPRVEYQFYYEVITNPDDDFSGDVQVVPKGSAALTMKGAIEMRRNEFLQIVGNPTYLNIIGEEGVAEILREMAKSLGLGENIVPSRIEIRRRIEEMKAIQQQNAQAQQQVEQQKAQVPLQTVQMQVQAADAAAQRRDQLKAAEIQANQESKERDRQVRVMELEERRESNISKVTGGLQEKQIEAAQKDRDTNKNVALSIESNFEDKNNTR